MCIRSQRVLFALVHKWRRELKLQSTPFDSFPPFIKTFFFRASARGPRLLFSFFLDSPCLAWLRFQISVHRPQLKTTIKFRVVESNSHTTGRRRRQHTECVSVRDGGGGGRGVTCGGRGSRASSSPPSWGACVPPTHKNNLYISFLFSLGFFGHPT